jgi:hypothetical protein
MEDFNIGNKYGRWEDQNCSVGKCVTILEPMCLLEWKQYLIMYVPSVQLHHSEYYFLAPVYT